ncbi:methionyl-tRNA formyltransferase [Kordiimonas marina]|uniref:methionyl-tRNA formyltransferase n=1 Tax=Kordiimonas marina TaxID=2872312 RepID=UPI001FF5CFD0|nr:methionyl-tRNA formyltransferase [Kordiimonas marina]MCJ9429928.1 methionyl-tRNA formyltransferase [Kordiimonas marina]
MRIAFMGTPDFALPTLDALIAGGHDIAAVYTQPPRPAGRGKREQKSPVHRRAEEAGLTVFTPISMKAEEEIERFAALELDCAVVVAFGQILPVAVLDAPTYGCVNVHASLLPRWRGAAPIHRALMAGDRATGVCIMQMEAGLDTGPVLMRATTPIAAEDTTESLHDRLAQMGGDLINDALEGLAAGTLTPEIQPEEGVTYAKKIDKAEARIDWTRPAAEIGRMVRGLYPFPGAWTEVDGERLKILAGHVDEKASGSAGVLLDDELLIACGDGAYRIDRAQRAGKAAMDREVLLRGFSIPAGTKLSSAT